MRGQAAEDEPSKETEKRRSERAETKQGEVCLCKQGTGEFPVPGTGQQRETLTMKPEGLEHSC